MTAGPLDTRKTAAEMMNVTRSAWRIASRDGLHDGPPDGAQGKDAFAWPVSEAAQANSVGDEVERFLRAQE